MMGIYIKGMEMPDIEHGVRTINIYADGVVTNYAEETIGKAVSVPPHGRLIDADAAVVNRNAEMNWVYDLSDLPDYLADCPTIIPAEEK